MFIISFFRNSFFLTVLLFSFALYGQEKKLAKIIVEAGNINRVNTPVSISLAGLTFDAGENLVIKEIKGSEIIEISSQLQKGHTDHLWWILTGTTVSGTKRTFELQQTSQRSVEKEVKAIKNDTSSLILIAGKKALQYNHAIMPPPVGASELYARSGFIHPLWSPSGAELTRIHAPDHIHHMGIWNPWTKTSFEGRQIDFWNLNAGQGTVRFANYSSIISGDVYGGFKAIQEHVDLKAPEGEKVAVKEEWEVRVWNSEGGMNNGFLWDFTSTLNCATNRPIILEEYRYAGFGFRATEQWHKDNSGVLTSEGKNRKEGDGTTARWCNVYGETEKGPAGILFMSHPANFNHPEPMRIWPLDANEGRGDMFFQFAPTREKDWKLEPGNDYVLKYRMYVYDGSISQQEAERIWQDFGNPPRVVTEKF